MKNLSGDQKQKLFILLGFAGFLLIVGFIALRPKGDDSAAETGVATAQSAAPAAPVAKAPAASAPAQSAPPESSQPTSTQVKLATNIPSIPAPERAPLAPSRPDPFAPVFFPTPPPEISPTPIPPPVEIPPPPSVSLPRTEPAGAPPSTVLVGLPSPRISRYNPLPGPRWVVPQVSRGTGDATTASRASDKRLSGVIIGDSVRALLEIQQGDAGAGGESSGGIGGTGAAAQVKVRVVQPGDEVDGIKILRINREFENGRPVTRMYILEGDQERYVDLRPSPAPPAAATGGEGADSSSSSSGRGSFGRGSSGSSSGSGSGRGGFGSGSSGGIRPFP